MRRLISTYYRSAAVFAFVLYFVPETKNVSLEQMPTSMLNP